jgi:hypothetical protein
MSQVSIAASLVRSGAALLATGFAYGGLIRAVPYPRIALSTHMNLLQHGLLSVAAGYILREQGLVDLADWQLWTVAAAHYYLWAVDIGSILNGWWGTNKSQPLVCLFAM